MEFHLKATHKIYWLQITDPFPRTWKDSILKDKENLKNWGILDYHIVRSYQIHSLDKLTSKEVYLILVEANTVKPAAQNYFENLFETSQFNWKNIYFLIRNTTLDTKARMFQYKVLHNILCANKMLFKLGKVTSPRCSFCKLQDETVMHLFYAYLIVKELWNQLKFILSNNLIFSKCHHRVPSSDFGT